jgi:hypothetical protein
MQLNEVAGNAVAVYPAFRKVLGLNAAAAQFLSQAVYWTERTEDGWFYKTEAEWMDEIGLSIKEVRSSRKSLVAIDLLEEVRKGIPAKMHYRVDTNLLMDYLSGQKVITSCAPTVELVVTKGQDRLALIGTTITENTQEITQETTSEIIPAQPAEAVSAVVEGELVDEGQGQDLIPVNPATQSGPRCAIPDDMPGPKDAECKTYKAWANYAFAYRKRYTTWPVWNAKAGGQLSQLIDRIGAEAAPQVAAYYLTINDARLINDCHSLSLLLAKAEGIHTQWVTGRQMNSRTARQLEDTQANINAAQEAASLIKQGGNKNAFL